MKLTRQQALDVEDCYRAAERIASGVNTGCCIAFIRIQRSDLAHRMEAIWQDMHSKTQCVAYWMAEYHEDRDGPEQQSRRVLALCFFAELIKTGDA